MTICQICQGYPGFQTSHLVICYLISFSCSRKLQSRFPVKPGDVTLMRHNSQKFALQNPFSFFTHFFEAFDVDTTHKPFPFHGVEWLEKTSSSWPFTQHGLQPTTLSNDLKLAHRTVKIDVNSVGIIKDQSPDIARNMKKHLTYVWNGDTLFAFAVVQCSFTPFACVPSTAVEKFVETRHHQRDLARILKGWNSLARIMLHNTRIILECCRNSCSNILSKFHEISDSYEERSLLWQSAARDRRGVEDAARRVADAFSTESVEAMKSLAFAAAWHCANRRRFFFSDAEKDRRSHPEEKGVLMNSEWNL